MGLPTITTLYLVSHPNRQYHMFHLSLKIVVSSIKRFFKDNQDINYSLHISSSNSNHT